MSQPQPSQQQLQKQQQIPPTKSAQLDMQQQILIHPQPQPQDQTFIQSNLQLFNQYKQQANQKYTNKLYSEAIPLYRKALQYIQVINEENNDNNNENEKDQDNKENQQNKRLKSIIYSNIGLTFIKMKQDDLALDYLLKSLKLNPSYTKARLNLAQCYQNLDKPQQAIQQYKKVLLQQQKNSSSLSPSKNPNLAFTKQKIFKLQIKIKQVQQKRKQQVLTGLKNIGNSVLGFFGMSLDNFKLQQQPGGGYNVQFKQ